MSQPSNNSAPANQNIVNKKMTSYDLKQLSSFLPNKKAVYDYLYEVKNLYLPDYDSQAVTEEYLKGVLMEDYETFNRNNIRISYCTKPVTKLEILHALTPLCPKPLGINENQLPDKFWLLNCLYSRNSNHNLFQKITDITFNRELPEG